MNGDVARTDEWVDAAQRLAKRMWDDLLPRMRGRFHRDEWFALVTTWPEYQHLREIDARVGIERRPWMKLHRFHRTLVQFVIDG